jgi:hypothetical protein
MNISDHILCWQALFRESKSLDQLTFKTLMFRFVNGTRHLSKSSSKNDFERAIETFRVQYLNEFMYNRTDWLHESQIFVTKFSEFSEKKRKSKNDYMSFLTSALQFYETSVGGSKDGVPLLSDFSKKCLNAPPYHMFWYHDQVKNVQKQLEIGENENQCAFCHSKSTKIAQIRPGSCPANSLPLCNQCDLEDYTDEVSTYLQKTSDFSMPSPTPNITQYINEINAVVSDMVINPNEPLVAYKYRLDDHGRRLSTENKRLKRANNVMENKMQDLIVVQQHIVADNEEYRISVSNLTHDCSMWNERAHQSHEQCQKAIARCTTLASEMVTVRQQFRESVSAQWHYYNLLNRR